MSSSAEARVLETDSQEPERDWRDGWIDRLEAKGFARFLVIATPPKQPIVRILKPRDRADDDYTIKPLPYETPEDEEAARRYAELVRDLNKEYGRVNVEIAYPTDAMIAENPAYGTEPHHLFMVRPPEVVEQKRYQAAAAWQLSRIYDKAPQSPSQVRKNT